MPCFWPAATIRYVRDFDRIAAEFERLFEVKRAKVAREVADILSGTEQEREKYQKAKRKFLRNLLSNDDLRRNPALVDFALEDATLGLAARYLGTLPYLNRVDLLYSVPRGADDNVASQLFHVDPEGLTQVKFFIKGSTWRRRRDRYVPVFAPRKPSAARCVPAVHLLAVLHDARGHQRLRYQTIKGRSDPISRCEAQRSYGGVCGGYGAAPDGILRPTLRTVFVAGPAGQDVSTCSETA